MERMGNMLKHIDDVWRFLGDLRRFVRDRDFIRIWMKYFHCRAFLDIPTSTPIQSKSVLSFFHNLLRPSLAGTSCWLLILNLSWDQSPPIRANDEISKHQLSENPFSNWVFGATSSSLNMMLMLQLIHWSSKFISRKYHVCLISSKPLTASHSMQFKLGVYGINYCRAIPDGDEKRDTFSWGASNTRFRASKPNPGECLVLISTNPQRACINSNWDRYTWNAKSNNTWSMLLRRAIHFLRCFGASKPSCRSKFLFCP
jgi:hypothetical protein